MTGAGGKAHMSPFLKVRKCENKIGLFFALFFVFFLLRQFEYIRGFSFHKISLLRLSNVNIGVVKLPYFGRDYRPFLEAEKSAL